jgi:hypothetical protein
MSRSSDHRLGYLAGRSISSEYAPMKGEHFVERFCARFFSSVRRRVRIDQVEAELPRNSRARSSDSPTGLARRFCDVARLFLAYRAC